MLPLSAVRSSGIDGIAGVFALTTFGAAFLLFSLEPMTVKMALPRLGGSSEVWTTCVLFYQLVLLAGYAYAHALSRLRKMTTAALLHGVLCVLAALTLPIVIPAGWHPPSSAAIVPWLLTTLVATVGLPFFVLSATSPLAQMWFARARPAANPYALYAASNVGSLAALGLYPFAIEPVCGLHVQSAAWSFGFLAFMLLISTCALLARSQSAAAVAVNVATPAITALRRLRWIGLAFVPSSLMLSVTTYLSERVAPLPLLWTIPLGIYLASFVIVFGARAERCIDVANRYTPIVLMPLICVTSIHGALPPALEMPLHFSAFAGIALVCHGALARDRPSPTQLTQFYLSIAIGGVLGSALNSIIAPLLFNDVFEYPIVIALACCALQPRADKRPANPSFDIVLPAIMTLAFLVALAAVSFVQSAYAASALKAVIAAAVGASYLFVKRPRRFALAVAIIMAITVSFNAGARSLRVERNFYGVKRVIVVASTVHELLHGHTVHGAEDFTPAREREPLTYYSRNGPLGDVFGGLRGRPAVAVVGLGSGSVACYRQPQSAWTFFEIDPAVVAIARDPHLFRYLADCAPDRPIVIGDGRLSLAAEPANTYDLIILDAYSSDAVPTHLLTREAVQLYVRRLHAHGIIVFHISNAYFDLAPLIAALANDAHFVARRRFDDAHNATSAFVDASSWVVVARAPADIGSLARDPRWTIPAAAGRVWTDDYSSIATVLRGR